MTHQKRCSAVVNMLGTIHAARAVGSRSEATTERKVAMQKLSIDGRSWLDRLDKNRVPLSLSSASDALKARRDRHKSRLLIAMTVEGFVQNLIGRDNTHGKIGSTKIVRRILNLLGQASFLLAFCLENGALMRPKKGAPVMVSTPVMRRAKGALGSTQTRLPVATTVEVSVQKSDRLEQQTQQDRLDQNRSPYSQFVWAGELEARFLPGKMSVDATEKKGAVMVGIPVTRRASARWQAKLPPSPKATEPNRGAWPRPGAQECADARRENVSCSTKNILSALRRKQPQSQWQRGVNVERWCVEIASKSFQILNKRISP